jgi:hypothetical protein
VPTLSAAIPNRKERKGRKKRKTALDDEFHTILTP